jgi:hypothetical protein
MVRIVLDPDEVNQDRHVTLTDGEVVLLADADRATLDRIARQLHVHRSSYAHALRDPAVGDRVASGELDVADRSPLYLRVARLQARARAGRRRPATELDVEVLLQDRTWTSSSGVTRPLVSLTPTHRQNLLGWLERNSDVLEEAAAGAGLSDEQARRIVGAEPWVAGTPLYRRLSDLVAAETARERAVDEARQVARSIEYERSGDWPDR